MKHHRINKILFATIFFLIFSCEDNKNSLLFNMNHGSFKLDIENDWLEFCYTLLYIDSNKVEKKVLAITRKQVPRLDYEFSCNEKTYYFFGDEYIIIQNHDNFEYYLYTELNPYN
ncbi:MAG: hypothetical protein JW737_03265, partial [Acidobacteria bacterium]|nr:hypothetical protein [Acidobacteriota bacterium]